MNEPNERSAKTVSKRPPRARAQAVPAQSSAAPRHSELRPIAASSTPPTDAAVEQVMYAEEAMRARGFASVIAGACFAVALWLPWLGGEPIAKRACLTALLVMGAVSLWFRRAVVRPSAYGYRRVFRVYGWTTLVGVMFVVHYCGVFSPVAVVLAFGISYFGQSVDRSHALLMTGVMIAGYFALGVLTTLGLVEEHGLLKTPDLPTSSRAFATVVVSALLALMLVQARLSRRAIRVAIARSRDALLVAQQREAQLAEAHHQLDAALRATIGRPGRYTGSFAGQYQMDLVIGVGAMGEVYSATRRQTGEVAAVKVLQAAALERDDLVERMLRETRISSQLDSPYLVRVFDAGRLEDGAPYLTMELLRGRDLAAYLREEGRLALPELVELARALGAGLQHAHDAGVVHRDLKPLNVFDAREPGPRRWKILDFGVSKLSSSSGTLTREGILGTPGYMSPEQACGKDVDYRSDVFSMGVLLYRALTGQRAFPGENTPQILFDVVYRMPARPSSLCRGVPAQLDAVLAIALSKDPQDRFGSAREFAECFEAACRGELSPDLQQRATSLLHAHPWGSTRPIKDDDRV